MIDKAFWFNIAEHWRIKDDVEIPEVSIMQVNPADLNDNETSEDEIDDILADLGFDDI